MKATRICLIGILPNHSLTKQTCNQQVSTAGTAGGVLHFERQKTRATAIPNETFYLVPCTPQHTRTIYVNYINSGMYSDIWKFNFKYTNKFCTL